MGVHGLWKLIEPSGKIVPLETLAGKVLAVDVSIWLHQALKGMHDAQGAPVAVAHLLILFHRICKLLFYKIKPVFVFDGGVPALKKQTMAARRQRTSVAKNEAMKVREKLIKNLLKHEAVRQMLSNETASVALGLNSFILPGPSEEEDLYKLPPIAAEYVDSESEGKETSDEDEESEQHTEDIHSIDVTSSEFLSLPPEVRHDILTELIETRKQSSWKHLDSMPKKSDNFSDFQMNRLLKRHAVQTSLEKAGKEMGGRALSLKELESLLGDQGVLDPKADLPSKRIAQDNVTRYMLVQKDSTEEKERPFDINEHLEDVGWSSESDTDIILERTSKKLKKPDKSEPPANSVQSTPVIELTDKPDSVPSEPKVQITKEMADILSVLEPESEGAFKSENNSNEPECLNKVESKVVIDEEKDSIKDSIDAEKSVNESKEHTISQPETSEEIENKVTTEVETDAAKDVNNFICTSKSLVEQKEEIKVELSEFSDKSEIKTCESTVSEISIHSKDEERKIEVSDSSVEVEKTKLDSTEPVSPTKTDISEKIEDAISSSDSENDFIPIETKEGELMCQEFTKNSCSGEKSSTGLTVVIDPSKSDAKDDIFADIFDSKSKLPEENDGKIQSTVEDSDVKETEFPTGDIDNIKKILEVEHDDLMKEKGKQDRHALNPTDQMYSDAQEMLRLFGIPFVVAPMEAEAQCAALNLIGLTEGTITDDSDIWLFGGQVVYKNFFNQSKHVLEYRSESIQKCFKLSREEMIKMALLVGSDYTVGLSGIGPVTALEILAAFQTPNQGLLDGLQNFRDWFTGRNKNGPQRITLRKKIKNTVILPGFPNKAVVEAYLNPAVDDSKEPFSWAKPNVEMIRKYVKARLGWSTEKCNELLRPVLKKLEENTTQSTLYKHFKILQEQATGEKFLSKRVEKAVRRLGGDSSDVEEPNEEPERKPRKKRKAVTSNNGENASTVGEGKSVKKTKLTESSETDKNCSEPSKIKLINQKLHQNVSVPQKEMNQKILESRKQEAIKIFRTFKKGKKKEKVFAKEKVKLSESSSSEND